MIFLIFRYFYGISPWKKTRWRFSVIFANKTSGRPSNPRARSQQLGGGQVLLLEGSPWVDLLVMTNIAMVKPWP